MNTVPCSSCGAPMLFVKTSKGKMIPLDPEPCPDGNIFLADGIAYFTKKGDLFTAPAYKSHSATCSNSLQHRKPK